MSADCRSFDLLFFHRAFQLIALHLIICCNQQAI